jgi:hypothetical protein
MIMIEDEDETSPTAVAADIAALFGQLVGVVADATPHSPVRRRHICEEIMRTHARVLQMLSAPREGGNGKDRELIQLWLDTQLH